MGSDQSKPQEVLVGLGHGVAGQEQRPPQTPREAVPRPEADHHNPGDIPQTHIGGKMVDDMRFMIACTNWY